MTVVAAPEWIPAYLAIGSNQDDPLRRVRESFAHLAGIPGVHLVARSAVYRSAPLGDVVQPDFFNAVAAILTQLEPLVLLGELKKLEARLGRTTPVQRWGPRVIDFDLAVMGDRQLETTALQLPHPGVTQRSFVLVPLAEIAPELWVPGAGRVRELAARCSSRGLQRVVD